MSQVLQKAVQEIVNNKPDDWIYDLEIYKNIFTFCGVNARTKEMVLFEISDRKDERLMMLSFLRKLYVGKNRMVGFNNNGFDSPLLHYILRNQKCSVADIHKKASAIIEDMKDDDKKWNHVLRAKDVLLPQVDLFKIHHFDNKARATSLKMIEFNMRSETIEDLPFPVNINLTDEQKDVLIEYNKHDVLRTLDFYVETLPMIEFRESMSKQYGRDFINHNDTKIGKDYFVMELEKENPEACYYRVGNVRKMRQTKRDKINLSECIVPYIKFNRQEFQAVHKWFKEKVITETKEVLTDLQEHELGDVAKYAVMVEKSKVYFKKPSDRTITEMKAKHPLGWLDVKTDAKGKESYRFKWRVAENLNVVIDGFRFDMGTGGAHGATSNTKYESCDEYVIKSRDVSSYYPNLSIQNGVYPEHLGKLFTKVYSDIYQQRKKYAKGTIENAAMKLALNGSYGASNDKFSPLYDPRFTMFITISGQLSLFMLAEKLMEVESCKIIMVNTDGLEYIVHPSKVDQCDQICKDWEKLTKLELEDFDYEKLFIRDVNNYYGVFTNGKLKRKGAYEYEGLGWHQNQSFLVVPMAAEHELLGKGTVEDFILNHKDKFDFMGRVKVPRTNTLLSVDEFGVETEEQKTCRYYVSNEGIDLVKVMPALEGGKTIKVWYDKKKDTYLETTSEAQERPLQLRIDKGEIVFSKEYFKPNEERRQFIEAGYKVTVCNNMKHYKGDINYEYYIKEARKLIDCLGKYEK